MYFKEWDISVCGLNCARCDLLAQKVCSGCRGSLDCHWSPDCKFLACIKEKGHDYCFECDEFPCSMLRDFADDGYDHHRITIENLKKIKDIGLKEWIEEQDKVMFCPGWIV